MKNQRTPLIKAFDKVDRVIGKGILLASASVLVPADTFATMITQDKSPKQAFNKVSKEIRARLNAGEGKGKHFLGANF